MGWDFNREIERFFMGNSELKQFLIEEGELVLVGYEPIAELTVLVSAIIHQFAIPVIFRNPNEHLS